MGQVNDDRLAYYQANGATSDDINDAELEFLTAQGQTEGHLNDRWFNYLRGAAYTGALSDMRYAFWNAVL